MELNTLGLFGLLVCVFPVSVAGQAKEVSINFVNPSFEDLPKMGQTPSGWYDCGKPGESAPDIQPGGFDVVQTPSNGSTYLGLVVRDNETWEGVSQRLSRVLEVGQCYEFTMDLCRSLIYYSPSRSTAEKTNYVQPCKVRVWGGMGYCDKAEMLFETPVITHPRWLKYDVRITPKKGSYTFILIEAFYKTPMLFAYNGNVMIDNLSVIRKVVCGMEPMPEGKPKEPVKDTGASSVVIKQKSGNVSRPAGPVARVVEPVVVEKIERATVRKGRVYRLEKVYFDANQYQIKAESEPELTGLLKFMTENPDVQLEVGGHTNNSMWPNEAFALELSTNRAKAVADWLVARGIASARVFYKGYGWKFPIEPNTTDVGKRKNQRVEVKILTMNGG
jgi:outer membrane protein OmpA-like peptidoglycan-associated protein